MCSSGAAGNSPSMHLEVLRITIYKSPRSANASFAPPPQTRPSRSTSVATGLPVLQVARGVDPADVRLHRLAIIAQCGPCWQRRGCGLHLCGQSPRSDAPQIPSSGRVRVNRPSRDRCRWPRGHREDAIAGAPIALVVFKSATHGVAPGVSGTVPFAVVVGIGEAARSVDKSTPSNVP
jgi:hypothetical protein